MFGTVVLEHGCQRDMICCSRDAHWWEEGRIWNRRGHDGQGGTVVILSPFHSGHSESASLYLEQAPEDKGT